MQDVDFARTARQMLAACATLTAAGAVWFWFSGGLRPTASFLFGAFVSVALLGLLARTLALLDVTGGVDAAPKASSATKTSLVAGQLLLFPVAGLVLNRFTVDVNAVACGFGVAVLGATLQQLFILARGRD